MVLRGLLRNVVASWVMGFRRIKFNIQEHTPTKIHTNCNKQSRLQVFKFQISCWGPHFRAQIGKHDHSLLVILKQENRKKAKVNKIGKYSTKSQMLKEAFGKT